MCECECECECEYDDRRECGSEDGYVAMMGFVRMDSMVQQMLIAFVVVVVMRMMRVMRMGWHPCFWEAEAMMVVMVEKPVEESL